MKISTTVRPATAADAGTVMAFLRLKAQFDGALSKLEATPETMNRDLFGDRPVGGVLLAEYGGRPIGFATYFFTYSSFLARPGIWLDDLYVREDHRGIGAGTALLAYLARLARDRGCGRLEWIVSAKNDRAIAFYERNGAEIKEGARLCRADEAAIAALADRSHP